MSQQTIVVFVIVNIAANRIAAAKSGLNLKEASFWRSLESTIECHVSVEKKKDINKNVQEWEFINFRR